MKTTLRFVCIVCVIGSAIANICRAEDVNRNPQTVYFTVGDAQDLLYTPLESKASIEAVFDVLHERYHTARVWWRGGQDEVWGNQFVLREQNRYYWRIWEWWRDLQYRVVKCNQLAVKAAHARGMELWMAYGLFDNGSGPDVGFTGFPYAAEDKIRVEHPEWAPVNKYGTWHQGGPIEFCYEGARRAMVEYLTRYVVEGGYDGIAFLTYAENYSQRYEEEFGYNQPIVDEFRKRYGVDIRTQPFDKVAWCKLRGEYLTQFFREFHESLSKNGKKIAMCVDGKYPYWPCRWGGEKGVRTAGKLWMDVETWVKEGIVDELNLFHPVNDEAIQKGFELCKGSSTELSTWGGSDKIPAGVKQLLTVNFDPAPIHMEAMYESMSGDKDAVVQVCACKTLTSLARQDPKKLLPKALEAVTTFFRQYGQGCGRADKDWGWRVAGNTLRDGFGDEGKEALQQMMQQKEDKRLAELAWRVVYLKQEDGFTPITEEQDRVSITPS